MDYCPDKVSEPSLLGQWWASTILQWINELLKRSNLCIDVQECKFILDLLAGTQEKPKINRDCYCSLNSMLAVKDHKQCISLPKL